MKKINFTPPTIIGCLCADMSEVPRALTRAFAKLKPGIAFLPFQVEKRYLKNTVACMMLMDVAGLVVLGDHRRAIARHLPGLDAAAKKTGLVDIVVRTGKKFTGKDIYSMLKRPSMGLFCQTCVEVLTVAGNR